MSYFERLLDLGSGVNEGIGVAACRRAMDVTRMAKEIGAYEKYGIDTELIYISSGPTVVQALLGGDVTGGIAATNAVVAAVLRGAPLVSVISTANRPYHRFWVRPEERVLHGLANARVDIALSGVRA